LQGACQSLYPSTCSTKLAATMLLMNICTFHGVSNNLKMNYCLFCISTYSHLIIVSLQICIMQKL
jgi:hypothetical protein